MQLRSLPSRCSVDSFAVPLPLFDVIRPVFSKHGPCLFESSHQQLTQSLAQHPRDVMLVQRAGVESIVISFAQKTFSNGQLTSKLHVIELGAPAGQHALLLCHLYQNCLVVPGALLFHV